MPEPIDLNREADKLGLSRAEALKLLQEAAGKMTAPVKKARVKKTHRLKWEKDALPDENPAVFAWRAYQAEAKAGTLHRGRIAQEDKPLAIKLSNWLRTHSMPEGVDIPTLPEWNTRQLANAETWREAFRLYHAARRRARNLEPARDRGRRSVQHSP